MPSTAADPTSALVVGAGPAGMAAAEVLAAAGVAVTMVDQRRSAGRKFLLAGRSGLNITNTEAPSGFLERYRPRDGPVGAAVAAFGAEELRSWCAGLGEPTFVGTSGQVFPETFRAASLLRAWLARLDELGVSFLGSQRFSGWEGESVRFNEDSTRAADVTLFALGGGSWPHVSSDGSWQELFRHDGIEVTELVPSNCGVSVPWTDHHLQRHEGEPVKNVSVTIGATSVRGDVVITRDGLEGRPVYALSHEVRNGASKASLDLAPDLTHDALTTRLRDSRRAKESTATWLRRNRLRGASASLLRESTRNDLPTQPHEIAALVKGVVLPISGLAGLDRAISSAGGVALGEIDEHFMLRRRPGTFVAGEMLDWDAPTGGYLLQACFSTGIAAARGALRYLAAEQRGVGS